MASGILIVDKPEDWTSQDVVAKLRGALHERRAGHGGTLDPMATGVLPVAMGSSVPMATGVLPVFFGRATRAVEFFEHAEKTYETVLRLGLVTDTQDITGRVLEQRDAASVTEADVRAVLPRFLGPQKQVPPMYSAIKIGGKKLYELARAGQEVARPARDITIHALELLSCAPPDFTLRVHCSKGTYVRTLCHDLGAALGTGGCMAALRRTAAGAYTAAQAVPLADILAHPAPESLLLPVDTLFAAHPALTLTPAQEKCCRNGASFTLRFAPGRYRLYAESGEFLALGEVRDGRMETVKSFFAI